MSGVSGENAATSYSASSSGHIAHGAVIAITERLAELSDLALPSSLYKEAARPPATTEVLAYLQALLQKDPAAFLARYGGVLQSQELNHFEALRSADFEVDHWLGYYAAQRMEAADRAANPGRLPTRMKNRRLAAMRRLAAAGEYFSEDAMRHRAPLLYHQQIGRFVDEEEEERRWQQQHQEDEENGERQEQAGQATCSPGPRGAVGGSCLASALRQALEVRDAPPSGAGAAMAAASGCGYAPGPLGSATGPSGGEPVSTEGGFPRKLSAVAVAVESQQALHVGMSGSANMDWEPQDAHGACDRRLERPGAAGAGTRPAAAEAGSRPRGAVAGANVLFSEFLMRQDDEAQLTRRRLQQQREEDAQMSEHDSDDDDDDEGDEEDEEDDCNAAGRACSRRGRPSASERAQMRRDFLSEMESRFLLGQDGEYVDYGVIDADDSLDGDWLEEESRDAEEKYFDED